MSLPRRYTLSSEGKLRVEPAGDLASLRQEHRRVETPRRLPRGEEHVFEQIKGNAMELELKIHPLEAQVIELKVLRAPNEEEYTRIVFHPSAGYRLKHGVRRDRRQRVFDHGTLTLDTTHSSTLPLALARPPEVAPVLVGKQKPVSLRVFIDRSIVEVFVNDTQCAAVRVYPGRDDSLGVSLRAMGGHARLVFLDAWQMADIYR
jgi:beta-fructofuranosidase